MKIKNIFLAAALLIFPLISNATTYYVATTGNDDNAGTSDKPWATLQKAINEAKAGDLVYIRGGIYYPTESVNWIPSEGYGVDGAPKAPIRYFNYPGESVVFDFINCPPVGNYNSGFFLNAVDYIQLKGMTVRNVKQTRDYVECLGVYAFDCTNLRFENMIVHNVDGNAFRFFGAWRHPGTQPYTYPEHANYPADSTFFINCDAYDCCDALPRTSQGDPFLGGAADGYKTHNESGSYILFEGCRAWNCSDDGFDASGPVKVVFNRCWSFGNGYLDGDGVGYKTGAIYDSDPVLRTITYCLAANNSTYGFMLLEYPDYDRVNARYHNNTAYMNGWGFTFSRNADKPVVLGVWRNNVSYKNTSLDFTNAYSDYTESNNSWKLVAEYPGYIQSPDATATDADFVSLNAEELKRQRQGDGSLPDVNFLKLAKGSDLIDKGIDVGLPFNGTSPDIGYSEYGIPVATITVTGAGGSSSITTDGGTLQLSAAVLPTDATNKTITWSVQNGTGQASISSSGLVTAIENGTVTARATANDGSGVYGQLVLTISNQIAIPVSGITVTGAGGATTINTDKGTLQLTAIITPSDAKNKTVTWSVTNGTGQATISTAGLVTAVSNGTVTARATAKDGSGVYGQLVITISNQSILVTSITLTGAGGATTITTDNGTLQLTANVLPANATNKTVTWSVTNGTGQATISTTGLVTAVSNGTVTARATAKDGSGKYGQLVITISNQGILVTGITLTGAGGATTITTDNGTLQLTASVLPANATNKAVTWSVTNGTGQATISTAGLVTAVSNGTVTARATAKDGSGVYGQLVLTISNQSILVTGITLTGAGGATTITTDNGTLQLTANVLPANATNKTVTWSVTNGTGQATISTAGLVTAVSNGTVTARATAKDGSGVYGTLILTISNQVIPVTGITVTGAGQSTSISTYKGTLQLTATILPANATNKSVTWSIQDGTGQASISSSGLVSAIENGKVTATATATDGSGISGSCILTITNQSTPTGIDGNKGKEFQVYQVSDKLIIQSNGNKLTGFCTIYSITGVLMCRVKVVTDPVIIDVSYYPEGVYIVSFNGNQLLDPVKVVIQQ